MNPRKLKKQELLHYCLELQSRLKFVEAQLKNTYKMVDVLKDELHRKVSEYDTH